MVCFVFDNAKQCSCLETKNCFLEFIRRVLKHPIQQAQYFAKIVVHVIKAIVQTL